MQVLLIRSVPAQKSAIFYGSRTPLNEENEERSLDTFGATGLKAGQGLNTSIWY